MKATLCQSLVVLPLFKFSTAWTIHASNSLFLDKRNCAEITQLLSSSVPTPPITTSLGSDEAAWKQVGEQIILQAATKAGARTEMIDIAWKSDRIIVTVDGSAYIPGDMEEEHIVGHEFDEEWEEAMDDEKFMEEDFADEDFTDEDFNEEDFMEEVLGEDFSPVDDADTGVDVVAIARAINEAFDSEGEGSVGYNIAVHHSIEVTTPGATHELSGIMFESYKGFDVILEFKDAKIGKTKKVEGRLVERADEVTRINERGRIRKFKNELVESVKLPKAKSEKGSLSVGKKKPKKSRKKKR